MVGPFYCIMKSTMERVMGHKCHTRTVLYVESFYGANYRSVLRSFNESIIFTRANGKAESLASFSGKPNFFRFFFGLKVKRYIFHTIHIVFHLRVLDLFLQSQILKPDSLVIS